MHNKQRRYKKKDRKNVVSSGSRPYCAWLSTKRESHTSDGVLYVVHGEFRDPLFE